MRASLHLGAFWWGAVEKKWLLVWWTFLSGKNSYFFKLMCQPLSWIFGKWWFYSRHAFLWQYHMLLYLKIVTSYWYDWTQLNSRHCTLENIPSVSGVLLGLNNVFSVRIQLMSSAKAVYPKNPLSAFGGRFEVHRKLPKLDPSLKKKNFCNSDQTLWIKQERR